MMDFIDSKERIVYRFKTSEINICFRNQEVLKTPLWLYAKDLETTRDFNLELEITHPNPDDSTWFTYTLQRMGDSAPLCQERSYLSYGKMQIYLHQQLAGSQPGTYQLLLHDLVPEEEGGFFETIGDDARFVFRVLQDGAELPHPVIRQMSVELEDGQPFLQLDGSVYDNEDNRFCIHCFTDDFLPMSRVAVPHRRLGKHGCHRLPLTSIHSWQPGQYICVLMHNGEPFHQLTFCIDSQYQIKSSNEPIASESVNYTISQCLEHQGFKWDAMRKLFTSPWHHTLKQVLPRWWPRQALDEQRKSLGLKPLNQYGNHLIYTNGQTSDDVVLSHYLNLTFPERSTRKCDANDLNNDNRPGNTDKTPWEHALEQLEGYRTSVVLMTNPAGLLSVHPIVMQQLLQQLHQRMNIALVGTYAEIAQVFERYPALEPFFPNELRLKMEPSDARQTLYAIENELHEQDLRLSAQAARRMAEILATLRADGDYTLGNPADISKFVYTDVLPRFQKRLLHEMQKQATCDRRFLTLVNCSDIDWTKLSMQNSFQESMSELNRLIGLQRVKQEITTTFNRIRFNRMRSTTGFNMAQEECHHMIFTGNPGTGKTTVAKFIGRIYHAMGLLSKGDVIVTERSQMVGRYIGETELNMRELLKQAQGNVLFIDEAYTLCDTQSDRKDFGYRAMECLLTVLAQRNPDMLVIMAGYEREMNLLLQANQGLAGRFPHHLRFDDYSADELMQIALQQLQSEQYLLTPEAELRLRQTLAEAVADKDASFSNARWLRQYITGGIIPAMADRLLNDNGQPSPEALQRVLPADVDVAWQYSKPARSPKPVPRQIGFHPLQVRQLQNEVA